MKNIFCFILILMVILSGCTNKEDANRRPWRLMTVAPGHFHASLLQKTMLEGVDSVCYIYGASQQDIQGHLDLLNTYNKRPQMPTSWESKVYIGSDFFEKMLAEKRGNIVVLAGNNKEKTSYINQSVLAGLNVLSDKPMVIDDKGFELLKEAFTNAQKKDVLIYDIMTERYDPNIVMQSHLMKESAIFGTLQKGSLEHPSVIKKSKHHFYKEVSGNALTRPPWYYDVEQEGEGIVDVTTHMIDLIQWQCFPEQVFDYANDIQVLKASRWPVRLSKDQFTKSTRVEEFPEYLKKNVRDDSLYVSANGTIDYTIKDVHASVEVEWAFQAVPGAGDTHYSEVLGSRSRLTIRQDAKENFKATLRIEPLSEVGFSQREQEEMAISFKSLQNRFPGLIFLADGKSYRVEIPDSLKTSHEEHFAKVAQKYLSYLADGHMPEWERSYILSKYYVTTQALKLAKE